MHIVIAGGGRTASHLANLLVAEGHDPRVIEHRPDVLARLHRELPTEAIVEGHPLDVDVIEHAGIRAADVFIACMPDDPDNLFLCFHARRRYAVPRILAVIDNPRHAWLFDATFHVDVAVNQADILAKLVEEEMSLGDMMVLLKLHRGRYSLVEEKIAPGARAAGATIADLALPETAAITAILRDGALVVPRADTVLQVGDEVLAVVDPQAAGVLAGCLGLPKGAARPSGAIEGGGRSDEV